MGKKLNKRVKFWRAVMSPSHVMLVAGHWMLEKNKKRGLSSFFIQHRLTGTPHFVLSPLVCLRRQLR
jgi:hypothetical protein